MRYLHLLRLAACEHPRWEPLGTTFRVSSEDRQIVSLSLASLTIFSATTAGAPAETFSFLSLRPARQRVMSVVRRSGHPHGRALASLPREPGLETIEARVRNVNREVCLASKP